MNHLITISKSDGTTELFEEEKLINSLKRVGAKPEVIDDIVDKVEKGMRNGMTTTDIYRSAFELLRKHSYPTALKYSVRRALTDLGPDGFPFEKFVARIFKAKGYDAVTDQIAMGACVEHEVDVIAWKDDTLAMVEAKFHNEYGMKSDVKVALYVKARFDDLAEMRFDYGGKVRKLNERWIITNTKFTDRAIKYGECQGLKMMGWNYPSKGNLHDTIEELKMHPITCLNSITNDKKKNLLAMDILTCSELASSLPIMKQIGMKEAEVAKALEETRSILS